MNPYPPEVVRLVAAARTYRDLVGGLAFARARGQATPRAPEGLEAIAAARRDLLKALEPFDQADAQERARRGAPSQYGGYRKGDPLAG